MKRRYYLVGFFVLLILLVPILVFLTQQKQETRSHASAATVLSFSPTSSPASPLVKKVGDTVTLDIMMNPGTNAVSIIKLKMAYDPNKLQSVANTFVPNTTAFPTVVEGPIIDDQNGVFAVTLSVGADPTKAIRTTTKVATINFSVVGTSVTSPTVINFVNGTEAYSVAATDQPYENVLSSIVPVYMNIGSGPTPTPSPTTRPTPTDTPAPTDTPVPTDTPIPTNTTFSMKLLLDGIGNAGDSTNPANYTMSNKNPQRTQRNTQVFVYNSANQLVTTMTGMLNYDTSTGSFTGTVDMGQRITSGTYTIKAKIDGYLRKTVSGIQTIGTTSPITLPATTLVAGDLNGDNTINIIDYNSLMNCYSDLLPAVFCPDDKKPLADLSDDGNVNQIDYNLFLREITVQNGN